MFHFHNSKDTPSKHTNLYADVPVEEDQEMDEASDVRFPDLNYPGTSTNEIDNDFPDEFPEDHYI